MKRRLFFSLHPGTAFDSLQTETARPPAVLLLVEANSIFQWKNDMQRGTPCPVIWNARPAHRSQRFDNPHIERLRQSGSDAVSSAKYWEFWSSLLDREQDQLEELESHPGWEYSARRRSINGGIDFQVGDDRDAILLLCGNSFLVQARNGNDRGNGARERSFVFEVQRSEANRWLSGASQNVTDLSPIPTSGRIRLNWIGTAAELKRKHEALDRFKAGKCALPGLETLLPEGPADSPPIGTFERLLSTEYNAEQLQAIRKALVPGTITSILGPPGTGKTSVIAEIAAQYAAKAKRVLISSQSNLAVDNALEKVTAIDPIFAVRIGRPESIKLNPDLLLDRASLRYRNRLLERSERGQEDMDRAISEQAEWLPDRAILASRIDAWLLHIHLKRAEADARKQHAIAKQAHDRAVAEVANAEHQIQALCKIAGLSIADLERFLTVGRTLNEMGITLNWIQRNRAKIDFTVKHRDAIAWIVRLTSELADLHRTTIHTQTAIGTLQYQISAWNAEKQLIDNVRRENAAFEWKKFKAGMLEKLWMSVTGPPHDLTTVEARFAEATRIRNSAEAQLPEAQSRLTSLQKYIASTTAERAELAQQTYGRSFDVSAIDIDVWTRQLDLAVKVQQVGGLEFVSLFDRHDEFDCAMDSLKRAISSLNCANADYQQAKAVWENSNRHLNSSLCFHEEIEQIARRMGVRIPPAFAPESDTEDREELDAFFSDLRSRQRDAELLSAKWPDIRDALAVYRSRLNQPVVDLQRAVINDSNVIGATCSGIAGSRDFESDFDCVIVDEAGRTTPLDLIMPVVRGRTVVLVGDYKQLPPFIGDDIEKNLTDFGKELMDRSIFQRIYETSHSDRRQALRVQYRMVQPISDIVREISYADATLDLECAERLRHHKHSFPGLQALHWVRPTGSDNRALETNGRSLVNPAEVRAVLYVLNRLVSTRSLPAEYSIGVISMYKQQALEIERQLDAKRNFFSGVQIEVGTVDSFQGREKDAVILSFAETDPTKKKFFYDRRRLNVAISRARELLVLVASLDKLGAARRAFGIDNPLFELRSHLEAGLGLCYSKEDYDA